MGPSVQRRSGHPEQLATLRMLCAPQAHRQQPARCVTMHQMRPLLRHSCDTPPSKPHPGNSRPHRFLNFDSSYCPALSDSKRGSRPRLQAPGRGEALQRGAATATQLRPLQRRHTRRKQRPDSPPSTAAPMQVPRPAHARTACRCPLASLAAPTPAACCSSLWERACRASGMRRPTLLAVPFSHVPGSQARWCCRLGAAPPAGPGAGPRLPRRHRPPVPREDGL